MDGRVKIKTDLARIGQTKRSSVESLFKEFSGGDLQKGQ